MLSPSAPNNWQYPSNPFAPMGLLWIFSVIGFVYGPVSFWIVCPSFKLTEIKFPAWLAVKSSEVASWSDFWGGFLSFESLDLLLHLFVLFFQDTHSLLGNATTWGWLGVYPRHLVSTDGPKQGKKSLFCELLSAFHLLVIPIASSCVIFVLIGCLHVATTDSPLFSSFSFSLSFKINVLCATPLHYGLIRVSGEGVLELVSLSPAARILSHLSRMLDNKLMRRRWRHP